MHRGLRAALAVTLVGSACSSGQILAVGPQRSEQHANWARCPSSVIDQIGDEVDVECAAVEVPVSYSDAETPTITIQMARVSATGSASNKKGVLFVNPGGPGGSGVDFLAQVDELPDSVRSHYDIIGFDPRGL